MKKPTIETLTKRLKRLNEKCDDLREKRDSTPIKNAFNPSREWSAAVKELNDASGDAMHLERQIINALLAQLP